MEHPIQSPKSENKRNGKPISLYPLDFDEAVEGLLATKPPPKGSQDGEASEPVQRRIEKTT